MNGALVLSGYESPKISINPDAEAVRATILAQAECVGEVTDDTSRDLAIAAGQAIADLIKEVEATHKAVKAPVWNFGKSITATKDNFIAPLLVAKQIKSAQLTAYEASKRRKREEEEAKRRAEVERLRREQAEAEAEEAQAIAAQKTATADNSFDPFGESTQSVDEANEEADKATAKVDHLISKVHYAETAPSEIEKPKGVRGRPKYVIEITDLVALVRFDPTLVDVKPRSLAIQSLYHKRGNNIPGLRVTREETTIFAG